MYVQNTTTRDRHNVFTLTGTVGAATTMQAGGFYNVVASGDTIVAAATGVGVAPGGFCPQQWEGKTTGDVITLERGHTQRVKYTWSAGILGRTLYASGPNTFTTTATNNAPVGQVVKIIDATTVEVNVSCRA